MVTLDVSFFILYVQVIWSWESQLIQYTYYYIHVFNSLKSTNEVNPQGLTREVTQPPFGFFKLRVAKSQDLVFAFLMFPAFPIIPTFYIDYCISFNSLYHMNQEFSIVTPKWILNIFSLRSSHSAQKHIHSSTQQNSFIRISVTNWLFLGYTTTAEHTKPANKRPWEPRIN